MPRMLFHRRANLSFGDEVGCIGRYRGGTRHAENHQSGHCPRCHGVLSPVMTPSGPGWRCSCR